MTRTQHPPPGERGAMTVVLTGAVGAALLLLCAGLCLGSAVLAAHRARAAADLGALAAAVVLQRGSTSAEACAEAAAVARRNAARPTACRTDVAGRVELATSSPVALRLFGLPALDARGLARAGPADRLSPGRSGHAP